MTPRMQRHSGGPLCNLTWHEEDQNSGMSGSMSKLYADKCSQVYRYQQPPCSNPSLETSKDQDLTKRLPFNLRALRWELILLAGTTEIPYRPCLKLQGSATYSSSQNP